MWKITSPLNFPSDRNIKHGSVEYRDRLPNWAKNNPRVVIQQVPTQPESYDKTREHLRVSKVEIVTPYDTEDIEKGNFYCLFCEQKFLNEQEVQKHFKEIHY